MRPFIILEQRSVLSILVIIVAFIFIILHFRPAALDPNFVAHQAQLTLAQASSYRFQLSVRTVIDQQDQVVSRIIGEFVQPNTYHLQGTSYDYKLDLYHLNDELLFLDPVDNRWKKSSAAPSLVTEAVLFTTSPIADFLTAQEFDLITNERIPGKRVYHLSSQLTNIANPYWEIFFSDFQLESCVNYPSYQVQRLRLHGTNSQNDTLLIELTFSDYNQISNITAPEQTVQEKM